MPAALTPFATTPATVTPFADTTATLTPFADTTTTPTPFAATMAVPTHFATSPAAPTPFAATTATLTPFAATPATLTHFADTPATPTPFAATPATLKSFAVTPVTSAPFAATPAPQTPFAATPATPTPIAATPAAIGAVSCHVIKCRIISGRSDCGATISYARWAKRLPGISVLSKVRPGHGTLPATHACASVHAGAFSASHIWLMPCGAAKRVVAATRRCVIPQFVCRTASYARRLWHRTLQAHQSPPISSCQHLPFIRPIAPDHIAQAPPS